MKKKTYHLNMESNELRINNRVMVNGKNVIVESIDCFGINKYTNCDVEQNDYDGYFDILMTNNPRHRHLVKAIEPIILTEGLLLDFGFKHNEDKGYCSDEKDRKVYSLNGFDLFIEEDGNIYEWIEIEDKWYSSTGKRFEFLHKLQNFYYELKDRELNE